ncbi:hypothetical protein BDA96_01G335800 [Sorghum bicolor]|uniref:non-specific serine/threonine protein kinase n=2 Tax=Sorghum bicolor TaxID=4558 RepID=A0A921S2G9_SORBI|nr:calcium-dependent protein kinase 23 [Sorghum bicolor]EER94580.1 hypothetical protein SORBI_3001G313100 [Sorghum bicolor]KAG0550411.1 hypothetical protein BDA96_01G335800 [Sorghum bicolor]|eukprot:XP_002467582.1 calcium-dependent protein kinase 23 [Sorghum bicolor]
MGNQCQNGTYGSNYNNYNHFQKGPLASRYYDGDDSEDCCSGPSRSSVADLMRQGLRRTLTSISVLGRKTPNVTEHYTLGRQLGEGLTGTTYLCTEISTGCQYACKSILKAKFRNMQDIEDVRREIQIMHYLSGQKHTVTIKDVYEDEEAVHIVMELCEGGELYDRIKKENYSEQKAADLIRIIVGIIENFHSLGVMHRDLKPENFLLQDKDNDLSIKVIDFGLSVFFKPGEVFTETVGSPYYIAPEVLQKHYGPEADVWTAGVILYVLLSGVPPFWADTHEGVLDKVWDGHFDFESDQWHRISDSAKDLIRKMLCPCPSERLKAHEVLKHPWICDNGAATHQTLDPTILSHIDKLYAENRSKKLVLQVIAKHLSEEEIARLRGMFKAMDNGNSGAITLAELKEGLRKSGSVFRNIGISDIMEADDYDNNININWEEFIAATVPLSKTEHKEHLMEDFTYFDKDGSGYITVNEPQKASMEQKLEDTFLEDLIYEVDQNNDGRANYGEFVTMMQSDNSGLGWQTIESSMNVPLREAPEVY